MKHGFSRQILEKYPNTKFHENPSLWSLFVPCGRTDAWTDGQTDVSKVVVPIRNKQARLKPARLTCFGWWIIEIVENELNIMLSLYAGGAKNSEA